MLILHANIRNRCWTSIDYLADKLGKSTATIESALKWLRKVGALEVVPFKERVGTEKTLPNRQHVYQLTGKLSDGEKSTEYLYVSSMNGQSEGNVLQTKTSDGKVLEVKTSEPEGHVLVSKSSKTENLTIPIEESTKPNEIHSAQTANAVADAPAGYLWWTFAGENTLYHLAKPTPTGTRLKSLCGCPSEYGIVASQQNTGKRQPCQDCQRKAADKAALMAAGNNVPPAKPTQPHILLIETWHNAHPANIKPIGKPNIVRNVKVAKELVEAGITPERLTAFMNDTYPGYIEWARSRGTSAIMSLEHIKNNIRAWEDKPTNGNHNKRYQPDDYGYKIDPLLNGD